MKAFCCTLLHSYFCQWSLGLLVALCSVSGVLAADAASAIAVGPNTTLQTAIVANERAFLKAVLAGEVATLNEMLSDDFVYVHESGLISTKVQFMTDFLSKRYEEAVLGPKQPEEPMRQYGNTVFTIGMGHLRLKGERAYPATTVTHVWVEQGGKWVLVHRHECHSGKPIGQQLGPTGGPNSTDKLGSKPSREVEKLINERSASWVYSMITTDSARMDELLSDSLRYIHVNGKMSSKSDFMKELLGGFTETDFRETTMRQFGNTVLVLHQSRFRHTGQAGQSPGQELHAWFLKDGRWVQVHRTSARFEN